MEAFSFGKSVRNSVIALIGVSTLVRLILASVLELGNDEVYYWTYAAFPDLSHFDHPPMVGFLIQATTINLFFQDDFFLRLGPILLAACNTWQMFRIGTKVKNETAGLYAALLYTSSIYGSIISGFSIIPDAPQVFFWLLCLNLMLDFLPATTFDKTVRRKMILFGCFAGLAMLSKYHSVFIWVGAGLYIVFCNRRWFTDYSLYLSLLISLLFVAPIFIWNVQNDFISFTFHGDRVATSFRIRPDYFFTELGGQIAYNNPFNYVLIGVAFVALIRKKITLEKNTRIILLLNSLPLYFLFTGFSLFRSTLPHWTGPAFLALIIIAAVYWSGTQELNATRIPLKIIFPTYFLATLLVVAVYVINYSSLQLGKTADKTNFGKWDFTQDMYGWESMGSAFKTIAAQQETNGQMPAGADLVSYRWFPGAHLDYYVAQPNHRNVYLTGDLKDTHKYFWMNQQRGGLQPGKDYYHIAVSNYYRDPVEEFGANFEKIEPIDTIRVMRGNAIMRYAFVYRMKNFQGKN